MTTLRSLVVDMGGFDDQTAFQWLRYFSQKYPNVENVDIGKLDLSLTDPLIWCCPGIFRRVTALHLTSLLEMDEYISLFDLLDKDACQIKQLKLHGANADCLGVLMRSDQSRYIQDLKLLDSEETTGFEWLSNLTSLTSLSLDYYSPQDQICLESSPALHLNDLLEACPSTVESISVLKIKITYDIGKPFPWIKCLKLVYSPTPLVGIDQFISACLPALTTLWLSLKVNTYHGVPILTMPNHHFASLHLFIRYPTPPYFKLVTSERTRCFATSISGNDYAILGNVLPRVMEREESMPTVHCASTKELYINEQCAYC
ncbi:hypothetical protein K501DRAFT_281819 [Backusella circina FSU 941]|nr:hypothetical protein K501DRAFT_281819 [Backusella circina FSU 941]